MKSSFKFGAAVAVAFMLQGCKPATEVVAKELPDKGSMGAAMVYANCTQCHGAPSPTAHSAEEWDGVVRRMQNWRVTKGFNAISGEDSAVLLAYLKKYARK